MDLFDSGLRVEVKLLEGDPTTCVRVLGEGIPALCAIDTHQVARRLFEVGL